MRGGAQAHLVEASDGRCYVVKFASNPQGRRVLVNELISALLLQRLGIATPEVAFVTVDDDFLAQNPECWIGREEQKIPILPGVHFGSRYPGLAGEFPIYDLFPKPLLGRVYNRDHFLGALVFDKWVSNADARQAVFYRAQVEVGGESKGNHWVAVMIDNGHAFQRNDWGFRESAPQGVYGYPTVYGESVALNDFKPWLDALRRISSDYLGRLYGMVPAEWIEGEERELQQLLQRLATRRKLVRQLLVPTIEYIQEKSTGSVSQVDHAARQLSHIDSAPATYSRGERRPCVSHRCRTHARHLGVRPATRGRRCVHVNCVRRLTRVESAMTATSRS